MQRAFFSSVCPVKKITHLLLILLFVLSYVHSNEPEIPPSLLEYRMNTLRLAIDDLSNTYGDDYPNGADYLLQLQSLRQSTPLDHKSKTKQFLALQQNALLDNPLLRFEQLLVVKRKRKSREDIADHLATHNGEEIWVSNAPGRELGFPSNHECNSSLERTGYDNAIATLSPVQPNGTLKTLFQPKDQGYVGELDLHWDGERILFTKSDETNWKIWELSPNNGSLRQVSNLPDDADCMDPCYAPDGGVLFGSTASYQSVPCWHGIRRVSNLYRMNADGSNTRQLCFDQDHDFHPSVLPNGQIIYNRWDYTGINHIFLRQLMVMNPDGTGQRAIYGSGSWFPNALYFPRAIPGHPGKIICILSGYHGVHRMGRLVLLDANQGWHNEDGIIKRISGKGDPVDVEIRDNLVDHDWPKFLHPYPLNDKYFLVACQINQDAEWGIYLADAFDNLLPLYQEPGYALFEPVPLRPTVKPPVLPSQVDLQRNDGVVYLQDIYAGPGLRGVPKGLVKKLRVISYDFGYRNLAGPDKIGFGGPWEAMRIHGTVPLEADGSAIFRVPANTPIGLQAIDEQGRAIQLMRSWFTVMPGEFASCVGCHETPDQVPLMKNSIASRKAPRDITPWYGPARGFDFAREVQPTLNQHCVSCHDGRKDVPLDLRREEDRPEYEGVQISAMGITRLHPEMRSNTQGRLRYTPAYDALVHYIRRVGIEDDVRMLDPGEYYAGTSELIQILKQGHYGVALDGEAWERLYAWIDLNAPCHGTWGEAYPIPENGRERRMAMREQYGGPPFDPEQIAVLTVDDKPPVASIAREFKAMQTKRQKSAYDPMLPVSLPKKTLTLGRDQTIDMLQVPVGSFDWLDPNSGEKMRVKIQDPFWISASEITNEQFNAFDPTHDSRYYTKRHARTDDMGFPLDAPNQPVVRVSYQQAEAFCQWLSKQSGETIALPSEQEWAYACNAGQTVPAVCCDESGDFSKHANLADHSFSHGFQKEGKQITGGLEHMVLEGAHRADARFDDQATVTAPVKSFKPNPWGLYDMIGNAAEWTRTDSGAKQEQSNQTKDKVIRGGSFFDPPVKDGSVHRALHPAWRKGFNVGFRIVMHSSKLTALSNEEAQ